MTPTPISATHPTARSGSPSAADHAEHGQRFEFPFDNHWNARGHDVAARSIADTLAELGLVAAAADAAK